MIEIPVELTLISSMFLHAGLMHLVGNMLFLWIFGDNVEEVLGTIRYVLAYLGFGLAGGLAQIAAAPDSLIPSLGASGRLRGSWGPTSSGSRTIACGSSSSTSSQRCPPTCDRGLDLAPDRLRLRLDRASGRGWGVGYLAHIGGATAGLIVGLLFRNRAMAVQAEAYRHAWFEPR